MSAAVQAKPQSRLLLSGNDAIARGVWEAGAKVAAAYPGTPSTEMLESLSLYPDLYAEWSVNEKVALEVAIGGSMSGARSFCAMKHVGLNVASDAFMTVTVAGAQSTSTPYTYMSLVQLANITSFTPLSGPTAGGTLLTIAGTSFGLSGNVSLQELSADTRQPLATPALPCRVVDYARTAIR